MKRSKQDLINWARHCGLFVHTYSPGDGVTRYRFSHDDNGYFGCHALDTCLGLKEAYIFIRGYFWGINAKVSE